MDHLFLSCPFANAMWLGSSLNLKSGLLQPISIIHRVQQWLLNIEKLKDFLTLSLKIPWL